MTNVEQAVLKQAQQEADRILGEAQAAADSRWQRESARLQDEHERSVETLKARLTGEMERELGDHESAYRVRILKLKNEIMEAVFQQASDKLLALPDDGYAKWLKARLDGVPSIAGGKVVCNRRDHDLMTRLVKDRQGKADLALAAETVPIRGGFVVQGDRVDLDYSLEGLLGVLREALTQEVANRLFRDVDAS